MSGQDGLKYTKEKVDEPKQITDKEIDGDLQDYRKRSPLVEQLSERIKELEKDKSDLSGISAATIRKRIEAESLPQSLKDENEQLRLNYNNLADEFNQQNTRLKRLQEAVDLVIGFIPEGFEIPLGFNQVMAQLKKVRDEI